MNNDLKKRLVSLGYITYEKLNNGEPCTEDEVSRAALSFLSLGFKLDAKSIDVLKAMSSEEIREFYMSTYSLLASVKGADLNHQVFYRNFPENANIPGEELLIRAILHYLTVTPDSYGFRSDDIKEIERLPYVDGAKLVTLSVISEEMGKKMLSSFYTGAFEAPKAIPASVELEMKNFVKEFPNTLCPRDIPFHMNVAIYVTLYMDCYDNVGDALKAADLSFVHTATDVLRVYAALSGADSTLQTRVRFVSLPRAARKILVAKLDSIAKRSDSIVDDLHMHAEVWKRAFEYLHVGEFFSKYPTIFRVATNLRNDNYVTYMARVEASLKAKDTKELVSLLVKKPGVFLRMLDALIRNDGLDTTMVLDAFSGVVDKISTTARISLWEYYKNRGTEQEVRSFVYRYGYSFVNYSEEDKRPMVKEEVCARIITTLEDSLRRSFKDKPRVEKVYISEAMKGITLPSNNLGASAGFHTLPTYSRVPLEGKQDFLRFFTYWKNKSNDEWSGRVDIDLSLEMFDKEMKQVASLSWRTLWGCMKEGYVHSGDFTSAPDGASEFVDVDLKLWKNQARYALIANTVYTGDSFAEIPDCTSGVMFRHGLGTQGEIFEPKDVQQCYRLTAPRCNMNLACMVDLETMELVWMDIPFYYGRGCGVAAFSSLKPYIQKATSTHMSVYDLVMLHKDHISFVENKEEAEYVIDVEEASTLNPYNIQGVISEWL